MLGFNLDDASLPVCFSKDKLIITKKVLVTVKKKLWKNTAGSFLSRCISC